MTLFNLTFWVDHLWGGISLISILAILGSSYADRRRQKRARIDDVGFMPWTAISVLATLVAVVAAALEIKAV